jgi:hypothetical protein
MGGSVSRRRTGSVSRRRHQETEQVRVSGDWTIAISPKLKFVKNEDSWQAHDKDRTVYVSSISVNDPSGKHPPMSGADLCALAAKDLGPKERLRFSKDDLARRGCSHRKWREMAAQGDHVRRWFHRRLSYRFQRHLLRKLRY